MGDSKAQSVIRSSLEQRAGWHAAASEAGISFNAWACRALDNEAQKVDSKAEPRDDAGLIRKTHLEPLPAPETPRVRTHQFKPDFKKGAS